jgi:hypothetical protein
LERHLRNRSLDLTDYLILCMVVVIAAVALITALPPVIALLSRTRSSRTVSAKPTITRTLSDRTLIHNPDPLVTTRRQVLKLVRSAERLNDAERELIRRISQFDVDPATDRLIAEIQICTNRMIRQLEDVAILNLRIDEKSDPLSTPESPGGPSEERRSNVELNNVTVL